MKKALIALLCCVVIAVAGITVRAVTLKNLENREKAELAAVTRLQTVVRPEDLPALERYPNLRQLDLSGSDCYDEMDAFAAAHPLITLRYTLPLGGQSCENLSASLILREGEYDYTLLLQALPHLKALRELSLPCSTLRPQELEAISRTQPAARLHVTRCFLGAELDWQIESLDLSAYDMPSLAPELPTLSLFENLRSLELTDASGECPFSLGELLEIHEAVPQARLHCRFPLFGQTVDSLQERLEFLDTPIGDQGLEQIRAALSLMPECRMLKLDDCGTANETMAALREELAGRVKVVWRVHYSVFSSLTDTTVIHAVAAERATTIDDRQCQVLRYCEDTEYIDLGHNPLTSIEFCRYMPKLKLAILSYNDITDLSPLSGCKDLVCLELFCCRKLQDLSPLVSCENLELLNVSFSGVTDISPVGSLSKLKLFHCARNDVPPQQFEQLRALLPDCLITSEGWDIHELGWRKESEGVYYEWYRELREIMGYARGDYSHK